MTVCVCGSFSPITVSKLNALSAFGSLNIFHQKCQHSFPLHISLFLIYKNSHNKYQMVHFFSRRMSRIASNHLNAMYFEPLSIPHLHFVDFMCTWIFICVTFILLRVRGQSKPSSDGTNVGALFIRGCRACANNT